MDHTSYAKRLTYGLVPTGSMGTPPARCGAARGNEDKGVFRCTAQLALLGLPINF
jgi:hypothetical protein